MLERSCVEDGGEERPCSFAPVRRFASIGAWARGPNHGLGDENRSVPGACESQVGTSPPVPPLADKAPSRWGRRAGQGRHGTGPPRSRQGRRPWWRLRSPGRKPRERSEPRRRPSFPSVVGPTRARRPAGGRKQGRFEPRGRTRDRCRGRSSSEVASSQSYGDQREARSPLSRSRGRLPTDIMVARHTATRRVGRDVRPDLFWQRAGTTRSRSAPQGRSGAGGAVGALRGEFARARASARAATGKSQDFEGRPSAGRNGRARSARGPCNSLQTAMSDRNPLYFLGISRSLRWRRLWPSARNRP